MLPTGGAGTIVVERFSSRALSRNRLGDDPVRTLLVWLPPGYARTSLRYPTVYLLPGYGGRSTSWIEPKPKRPTIRAIMARVLARGAPPAILVMPDPWSRYGGAQFLDSPLTGGHRTHLVREIIPHVDRTYRTIANRDARGVLGKSSGGFGALRLAMDHPELFGACACHSGDMFFEVTHKPMLAALVLEHPRGLPPPHPLPRSANARYVYGLAAAYSPDLSARPHRFRLPVRWPTGEIVEGVWRRWCAEDPLVRLPASARALRSMRLLYLDCGDRDEFRLQLGARLFVQRARRMGIRVRYEEFPGGHFGITHRYLRSLPLLLAALRRAC